MVQEQPEPVPKLEGDVRREESPEVQEEPEEQEKPKEAEEPKLSVGE